MESAIDIPFCRISPDPADDVFPMLIVFACFIVAGWLLRKWKKRRGSRKKD